MLPDFETVSGTSVQGYMEADKNFDHRSSHCELNKRSTRSAQAGISVLAKNVPGEGVEKFVNDDSITTGPSVPNRWRRHISIENLLLDRRPPPLRRGHFPVREVIGGCSGHQSKPYYQSG